MDFRKKKIDEQRKRNFNNFSDQLSSSILEIDELLSTKLDEETGQQLMEEMERLKTLRQIIYDYNKFMSV